MTEFPHVRLEYTGQSDNDRPLWKVLEPMGVSHPILGAYTVPGEWVTDLASVPRTPLSWFVAGGQAPAAAVVHDWLYRADGVSRKEADAVFYDLIRREGYGWARAYAMWAAVRVGGWKSWNNYRVEGDG